MQSAARVVDIIKLVAEADGAGITAREISDRLGLPRQVIYHLTHTLTATHMLRKIGRSSYLLGLGLAPIVQGFRRQMGTSDLFAAYCRRAAAETGESAYVSGWVNDRIAVLASAAGSAAVQAAEVPLGTSGDAHARASGKLLLAMASEEDVRRYIAANPMTPRTANTCTSSRQLEAALQEIRQTWIAFDREEYAEGLSCLAVPIHDAPSQFVLGISAPTQRFNDHFEDYVATLKRIAESEA